MSLTRATATVLTGLALLVAVILTSGHPVTAEQAVDQREAIGLEAFERAFVLEEMRGFLGSVEGIISALASDRVGDAAAPAQKSGLGVMHHVPPTLREKLPGEFRQMGHATHAAFDTLAEEARTLGDKTTVLKQLETILNTCNTCHTSYRLTEN